MVNQEKRKRLIERMEFRQCVLEEERKAYIALLTGGVQSYAIGTRSLTKFDLPKLEEMIRQHEDEIEELESQLAGGAKRKSVGVVPRDW